METLQKKTKANNTVNVLNIYRHKNGIWAFDDDDLGIVAEPFVGSINTMIDMYAKGKKNLTIYISSTPLPDGTLSLTRIEDEIDGMYMLDGTDIEGWLCPCFLNFFPTYVDRVYVKIEN